MRKLMFLALMKIARFLPRKTIKRIPGMLPICKFIYRKVRPSSIVLQTQGNKMFVNCEDEGVVGDLLIGGTYEKYATEVFKNLIKPGMVVVDIGANIGYYTLIASRLVGKKGKVYAFEPEPNNFKLLIKNIQINGYKNVVPVQKAISNKKGKIKLFTDEHNLGGGSFSERNILDKKNVVEVGTISLDKFLGSTKIDFIKMDVQGAEGRVVEGAIKILQNNDLKIVTEFWPNGLKNLGNEPKQFLNKLQKSGFSIKIIDEINQRTSPIKIEKLIEVCQKQDDPMGGYVNLLLDKH